MDEHSVCSCGGSIPACARPGGGERAFAELGLRSDAIPGGGHLNSDAGYRPWPSALAWCLDERTRLEGNESWGAG